MSDRDPFGIARVGGVHYILWCIALYRYMLWCEKSTVQVIVASSCLLIRPRSAAS